MAWRQADAAFHAGNHSLAAARLERLDGLPGAGPARGKGNTTLMLMRALTHVGLGQWALAGRECTRVLQHASVRQRGGWQPAEARSLAVVIGAKAGMEMGDEKQALKFYRRALRSDPDHKRFKGEYRQLKTLLKLAAEADKKLADKWIHKGNVVLDKALALLDAMGLDTDLFRSNLVLKKCGALSGLKRHEEAIMACDSAVAMRGQTVAGVFANPQKVTEALVARAKAHMADSNFDEAVRDYRGALEQMDQAGAGGGGTAHQALRQEVDGELHTAKHKAHMWKERRDHALVLELPVNIHEVSPKSKCGWLKKQYKKMAKKW